MTEMLPQSTLYPPARRALPYAWAGSLIVHAVVATLLALQVYSTGSGEGVVTIQTGLANADPTLDVPEIPSPVMNLDTAGSPPDVLTQIPVGKSEPLKAEVSEFSEFAMSTQSEFPAALLADVVGAPPKSIGNSDSGAGDGKGTGEFKFFGLPPMGDRVVYICDASRSMNHSHPLPARTRFNRVKLELVKTVGEMQPEQKFFLMFFNDDAIPMPANRMMEATPATQQAYLQWMVGVRAEGRTNPVNALLLALQLQPDTIFLLTDGDLPPKVSQVVARANQGRVTIHTIGFGEENGAKILKEIAEQNGGEYRFIPDSETSLTSQ